MKKLIILLLFSLFYSCIPTEYEYRDREISAIDCEKRRIAFTTLEDIWVSYGVGSGVKVGDTLTFKCEKNSLNKVNTLTCTLVKLNGKELIPN